MIDSLSREREAGKLYSDAAKAVRAGGHELRMLAGHLILVIKGTAHYPGALWPVRELHDGKVIELDRFIDYLLRPPRDGLGLPSLYFLKQSLAATPQQGERALAMVRAELAKEHVDFDMVAHKDQMRLHGERAPFEDQPRDEKGMYSRTDNIRTGYGTSAAYLAARLKRDHPEIVGRLASGEFPSVRAAAIEAGIITKPTRFEMMLKWWPKLTPEERRQLRAMEIIDRCGRKS